MTTALILLSIWACVAAAMYVLARWVWRVRGGFKWRMSDTAMCLLWPVTVPTLVGLATYFAISDE